MADDMAFLKTALNPFGPRKAPASPPPSSRPTSYGSFAEGGGEIGAADDDADSSLYQSSRLSEDDEQISPSPKQMPKRASFMSSVSDFANVFKAFIGTNYLSMPFAFSQAGLAAGSLGIILVATLTDHCCNLIVRCKKACVYSLIESSSSKYLTTSHATTASLHEAHPQAMERLEEKAEKAISYPDIGRYACGRWAENVCSLALLFTEFGFALNYFVFIGNTLDALIQSATPTPTAAPTPNASSSVTPNGSSTTTMMTTTVTTTLPSAFTTAAASAAASFSDGSIFLQNNSAILLSSLSSSDHHISGRFDLTRLGANYSSLPFIPVPLVTSLPLTTPTATPFPTVTPAATDDITMLYLYLIAAQIPVQVGFSLVRDVRKLGPFSTLSNFAILIGYVALLSFFFVGFDKKSDASLAQWSTLPMFFAATTSNYEGIGTIVPIESSMSGNRHRYPKYLHAALFLVTMLLGCFGLSGYARYGSTVDQVITVTVSKYCASNQIIIVQIVNATLCLGILLTYPLHMFVLVETLEPFFFGASRPSCGGSGGGGRRKRTLSCRRTHRTLAFSPDQLTTSGSRGSTSSLPESSAPTSSTPARSPTTVDDDYEGSYDRELERIGFSDEDDDYDVLSNNDDDDEDDDGVDVDVDDEEQLLTISVPVAVPDNVPRWKRNVFRVFMVLLTAVMAACLKNYFFYVSAVTGSLGSVLLAYVLPCYFHIKLCPNELTNFVLVKDIAIICFGLAAGVAGLYSVINTFV